MSEPTAAQLMLDASRKSFLWKFLNSFCRIGTTLFFDLKVYGKENVPPRGGAVLLANHQSYLDPVLVAVQLHRPVSFMAKSELFEGKGVFAWLIRALHAYPVKQGRGDVSAIKKTIERLHQGFLLNIYPEGTRTEDGEIKEIQAGIALLVRRADVPIVPVVIHGSFEAWPRKKKLFRRWPIRVMYGPPMDFSGMKGEQIVQKIDRTLRAMLVELKAKDARNFPR